MKKLLAIVLLCLVLLGCSKEVPVETHPTEAPTVPPTTAATEPATEPPTEPPTEPAPAFANPLTGEACEEPITSRPFAVMLNNLKPALPQCGVSEADWLFEVVVEGGITRCMGLFTRLPLQGDLGSIRSARPYYVKLAQAYDAIYIHAGGSNDAYAEIRNINWDHIDGVNGPNAERWFYRNQERLNRGVSLEHTMFISTEDALDYMEQVGCTFDRGSEMSYGLLFDEDATPMGETANQVVVSFRSGGKTTTFTYDESDGLYRAAEYGSDYIDGNTEETLAFRNILVLQAPTSLHADGNHQVIDLLGSGEGSFACGGKCVSIRWSRSSDLDPFQLTLEDGTPLTLGVGKSYVGIVPTGSPLELS